MDLSDAPAKPRNEHVSWAFALALALLAPVLFLSLLFAVFAPVPLLYLHRGTGDPQKGRWFAWLAVPFGAFLCFLSRGWPLGLAFLVLAGIPALVLGESLRKQWRVEICVALAVGVILAFLGAGALVWGQSFGVNPLSEARTALHDLIAEVAKSLLDGSQKLSATSEEEIRKLASQPDVFLREVPGLLLSSLLLSCSLPVVALIRWNPKGFVKRSGIPRDFLRRWKTPEWLVWPALAAVALLIWEVPIATDVAQNLLKPIILIYFFQGMSILAFFLDSIRWRGTIRALVYGMMILFLTPMLVSFGFFDLWFDFRKRFRSLEE